MNRRGFLRGILASAAGGAALVKLASAEETKALTLNQPVLIGQPEVATPEMGDGGDGLVYMRGRATGEFTAIGYITHLDVHRNIEEISSWNGTVAVMPGLR